MIANPAIRRHLEEDSSFSCCLGELFLIAVTSASLIKDLNLHQDFHKAVCWYKCYTKITNTPISNWPKIRYVYK